MTKAISLIVVLAMVVHLIRPLGLPGLKKRSDFWKLAVAALVAIMLVAVTKGEWRRTDQLSGQATTFGDCKSCRSIAS